MGVVAIEGIVQHGQILLKDNIRLPEQAKVYVLVPGLETPPERVRIVSPRLRHPEQLVDFKKEMIEVAPDADI
jgi:hypothetical protein